MNVYKLKILKEGDSAVPLVKIVFALAARTPCLTVVRHPPSADYNAVIYEIWCAGISKGYLLKFSTLWNRHRRTLGLQCFRLRTAGRRFIRATV